MTPMTLALIDAARGVTLRAYKREPATDPAFHDLAVREGDPRFASVLTPCEAQELALCDAQEFLAWLQRSGWAARLEQDLQCMSEDEHGRRILTTCMEMREFALLIESASGHSFRAPLSEACERWYSVGADVVSMDGLAMEQRDVCRSG